MAQNQSAHPFDVALPVMYVAPGQSLTGAYISADSIEHLAALGQAASSLGVTLSLVYTYWDPSQRRYVGMVVLDQTNTQGGAQRVTQALGQAPGVQVLATAGAGPGSGLVAFEQNRLNVAGTPVVVIARPFLGGTHRRLLEALGDQAATLLFQSGQSAGQMAASGVPDLVTHLGVPLSPDLVRQRFRDLQVFSWATVVDLKVNDRFAGEARLADDFEAAIWQGQAQSAVCHWIRGFLTGALSSLTGHAIQVSEPECQAKGDQYCRMTFQAS